MDRPFRGTSFILVDNERNSARTKLIRLAACTFARVLSLSLVPVWGGGGEKRGGTRRRDVFEAGRGD